MIRLSKRLKAAADFVPYGSRVVDIGTDHAYLPMYLVQSGKAVSAVAADVKTGPLERAGENIRAAGLSERIAVRRSDGLSDIRPGEGDVLVIAGMGGMLMLRILEQGDLCGFRTLILAPQSDLTVFRRTLIRLALRIEKETLVYEDGKYYPVVCAVHGRDPDDDPVHLRYGKNLLPEAYAVMRRYLDAEHQTLVLAASQIRAHADGHEAAVRRLETLEEEIRLNEEAAERIRRGCAWNETFGSQ